LSNGEIIELRANFQNETCGNASSLRRPALAIRSSRRNMRTQNGANFEFDRHVARPQEARKVLGLAPP
jgi:hypothetical protein